MVFMRPDQLDLLTAVGAPSVRAGTDTIAFATSTPSFLTDGYRGFVYTISAGDAKTDAAQPGGSAALDAPASLRRWTRHEGDRNPVFSPDGSMLAFTRPVEEKPQIFIAPVSGGEPWQVTDRPLGVSEFAFSPDSAQLAFVSREPEVGRYGETEGVDAGHEDPRVITSNKYQENGLGYALDRPGQVFVVDVSPAGPEPRAEPTGRAKKTLTAQEREARDEHPGDIPRARRIHPTGRAQSSPKFSADGNGVYLVTTVGDDWDSTLESTIVFVPLSGDDVHSVTNRQGPVETTGTPWPSQDGTTLFYLTQGLGESGTDFVARQPVLMAQPVAGGAPVRLTDPDRDYVSAILDESSDAGLLFTLWERGQHILYRARPDSRLSTSFTIEKLSAPELSIESAAVIDPERIAVTFRSGDTHGDIGVLNLGAGAEATVQPLTDFSATLREESTVITPLTIEARSTDGYPIHGWVLAPKGKGPHPVLLNIHGGPFHAYDANYFDEAQVYAEAGYAVVMCNPRGSASYGRNHGLAIKDGFGTVDQDDALAFLDHTLTLPNLDEKRVGIMGGSYGGYLTAWILSNTDRFAAAIVERGFLEPHSFQGTSDIGWFFGDEYVGTSAESIARQSPMEHADKVSTPTIVIHSEDDLRCPLEQGQRYYTKLKRAGVETELVVFPGENHELTRSGTPWHRRRRFEIVLDWFARHMPVG